MLSQVKCFDTSEEILDEIFIHGEIIYGEMETQVGLKTTALTLFLNLFFHFLPAAALCDDFSLVDSVET